MAGAREANVVAAVRAALKQRRAFFFKSQSGAYGGLPGLPDFVVCYRGLFVGLECKRPVGGRVSPQQKLVGDQIRAAGGIWEVVISAQEAHAVLDGIDRSQAQAA